ncbi:MAG: hypothetical protein JNM14_03775 [Ferruginibacter sp.]|nr:hypothetical protein [Ferruginibacter sp.]
MKKLIFLFAALFFFNLFCIASAPTDYFRSVQTGDWNALSTWESSPDNATWSAATLIPTNAANIISINTGHTITVGTNQDMDQVIIYIGATLEHNAGTLTVNDGAGDDIIVLGGGTFHITVNPGPVFSGSATMRIFAAGTLMLSAGGQTGAGTGVNASNYIYGHQSVLEYTLPLAFSTSGVTYFPNVAADTIPTFRTTNNIGIVGAIANTTFNGIFEANGNITFANSGDKIFRNGILGTGNIDGTGSGKFIINGNTAVIGGTGLLTVPTVAGMDIGNGTGCNIYLASAKTINNNIALLNNTYFYLLGSSLTMNGDITGGSVTSHVVTNSLGTLIINNIGATPRGFPVGATAATFNPMFISNGGGLNYGVRVETGINPAIAVPVNAVNRTWFVTPAGGTPGTVNTNFFYYAGDANAGFNYAANLELGQFTGVWNVIQTGIVPAGSYQVATTVSSFAEDIEAPLVLANLGAILSINESVSVNYFTGIKHSDKHLLKWQLTCNSTPNATIELERSTDGRNYSSIYSISAMALRCQQPFDYTDARPAKGVNYYRLKMADDNGKITYSTVVPLINAVNRIDVMIIAPSSIVNRSFNLKVSSAEKVQMELVITDMQGRILQKQSVTLIAGFNTIPVNVKNLAAGTYQLFGNSAGERTRVLRFVAQ